MTGFICILSDSIFKIITPFQTFCDFFAALTRECKWKTGWEIELVVNLRPSYFSASQVFRWVPYRN